MLASRWNKMLQSTAFHAMLSRAILWWMTAIYWPNFVTLPFDALNEGDPLGYRVHIWYGKTRMAGLQSGEGRMMIDSVVWAQYINVTDTPTDRQTRRHSKCCANVLCIRRQKSTKWLHNMEKAASNVNSVPTRAGRQLYHGVRTKVQPCYYHSRNMVNEPQPLVKSWSNHG